jgi:hypothetical protein
MNQLEKDKKPQFLRKLNLLDSTSLVIGAVIGSGIFMTAEAVRSPLLSWEQCFPRLEDNIYIFGKHMAHGQGSFSDGDFFGS